MKKPRKIAFETCLWFGLILVTCFLCGCQSARKKYTFSPLPSSPPIFDDYRRITITNASDQRVYYVGGQVKQPGRQVYIGETTVTKAIQSAGDFTDFADGRRVKLMRANGEVLEVDCLKLHSPDPPVYPGDKIDVPQRSWRNWFR